MPTLWTCSQQRSSMLTKPVHSHLKKTHLRKVFWHFISANFTEKFHRKKVHMFTSDPFESQGTGVCTKASPLLLVGWSRCSPRCVVSLSLSQFGGQDSQVRGRLKHGECWRWVFFKAWCFFRSWNLKRFFSCGGGGGAKFGYWNVRRWDKIKTVDFQSLKVHSFFSPEVSKRVLTACIEIPEQRFLNFARLHRQDITSHSDNFSTRDLGKGQGIITGGNRVQQSPRCVSAQVVQCQRCPAKLHQITLYIQRCVCACV